MKKLAALLLAVALAAAMLTSCESRKSAEKETKEKVVVALWGNDLLENYTRYLCDAFPEVEFEFVLVPNSTDYYRYRHDHGDMPEERMLALQELYLDNDIACYIGEDTPF